MARMKELEAENARLKKMYIEENLKAEILNEAITKKWWGHLPDVRSVSKFHISIKHAYAIFSVSKTCYRYDAKSNAKNELIANWLIRITDNNQSWGFGLCYVYLLNFKHFKRNRKRIYRIYQGLELNLRIKPRKRLVRNKPDALVVPLGINQSGLFTSCTTSSNTADPSASLTWLTTLIAKP